MGSFFSCVPCFSSRYTPPSFIADGGYEGIDSSTPSTPRRHPQRHRRVHPPPCWVETAASAALAHSAPPRRMSAPRRTPTASTSPAVAPRLRRRDSRAANNIRFTIHQFGCKETNFSAFRFFMYFCTRNETCSEYIFIHRHADTDAVRGIGGIGGEMFVHREDNAYDTNRRWLLSWRERMYDVEDNTPVGLCALGDGTRRHAATAIPVPAVHILQYRITDSCHPAFGVAKCRCSSGRQSEHSYCTESLIAMH